MILKVRYKGKDFFVNCKEVNVIGSFLGLMFKFRNNEILYFKNCSNIHSIFVFKNFLAVWLDKRNNVVKIDLVKPFSLLVKRPKDSKKLLEIPIDKENSKIIKKFLK